MDKSRSTKNQTEPPVKWSAIKITLQHCTMHSAGYNWTVPTCQ